MLSVYLIIIVSGLAAAGLSFLTWVILLLSLGSNAITANVIAAIGLTYFLLHVLVLSMLRQNLKNVFQISHSNSNPGVAATSTHPWLAIMRAVGAALKRYPALRRAAWAALAAAAILLILAKGSAKQTTPTAKH